MKSSHLALAVVALVALVALGAVASYEFVYQGNLRVYVKDSTGGWAHVNVTFTKVEVQEAGKGNESGWHGVSIQDATVDLVGLTNASKLLASDRLPPGKYTEIRIVVASVAGQMANGTPASFTVPSGELKTTNPFEVTSAGSSSLTLDFDLSRCIVQNGDGYTFTPVLGSISNG